jgi:predicted O-methyltransferase YrrM
MGEITETKVGPANGGDGAVRAAAGAAITRMIADEPAFHSGGTRAWLALPATLELLAEQIAPGSVTVETGAGASTVVFAALGTEHVAISPASDEHRRIGEYCETIGVNHDRVSFRAQRSDDAIAELGPDVRFDAAFIDGRHSFPQPVVDFHLIEQRLRVGGLLVLDDVPIPAVGVLHAFLVGSPDWEFVRLADDRAGAYRKLADADSDDNWRRQPFNRTWPDFSFLPWPRRLKASATERIPQRLRSR